LKYDNHFLHKIPGKPSSVFEVPFHSCPLDWIALPCLTLSNRLINLNITRSGLTHKHKDFSIQELLHSLIPFLPLLLKPRQHRTLINRISGTIHIIEAAQVRRFQVTATGRQVISVMTILVLAIVGVKVLHLIEAPWLLLLKLQWLELCALISLILIERRQQNDLPGLAGPTKPPLGPEQRPWSTTKPSTKSRVTHYLCPRDSQAVAGSVPPRTSPG